LNFVLNLISFFFILILRTGSNVLLHWFVTPHCKKFLKKCNKEKIYVSVGPSILTCEESQQSVIHLDLDLLLTGKNDFLNL